MGGLFKKATDTNAMAKVSLSSIITGKFISRLAAAGREQSSATTNPLRGNSSVSLSGSLRLGAQTYATAVSALNNTLSIVNIARGTLESLGEITDKMIDITEKAARRPVGPQGRRALDVQFRELAAEFKKVVEKSEIGDKNFLSVDGLTELFMAVGLDKETSSSIAGVFAKFITPADDSSLASEKIEGKKPFVIPAAAFTTRPAADEYKIAKVTDFALTTTAGAITSEGAVVNTVDNVLNQNSNTAVLAISDVGSVSTQPTDSLAGGEAILLAVNETTGYSIVSSIADPFGYNLSGNEQLFLLDETGAFVGQLTTNDGSLTYLSADMAKNDETFAINYTDGSSTFLDVFIIGKGSDPGGGRIDIWSLASAGPVSRVKIDDAGEYVAFNLFVSGSGNTVQMVQLSTGDYDLTSASTTKSEDLLEYGFIDEGGVLAISKTEFSGASTRTIDVYTFSTIGGSDPLAILGPTEIEGFATLEGNGQRSAVAYGGIGPAGEKTVYVVEGWSGGSLFEYDLGTDTIQSLSLARSSASSIDVGVIGALTSVANDPDFELYRISFNPDSVSGRRIRSDSAQYSEILDPKRSITSRPAAYRMLNDLKALREQITENVDALSNAFKVVSDNITLVRATGLALLEIGNELTTETDAERVAESLRQRIREGAREALNQLENLDPIAVATLTYSSKGN